MKYVVACLRSEWTVALFVGIFVALLINAPLLRPSVFHRERLAPDIVVESSDELFYMSRIREVIDGFPLIGNPTIFERRFQRYPLGILMENMVAAPHFFFPNLSVKDLSIGADIFLPFVLAAVYFLALRPVFSSISWRLLTVATLFLGSQIILWKRPISPQATAILPILWLFFFYRSDENRSLLVRWILLGFMLYSYPFHWTYCIASEALWMFYRCYTAENRCKVVKEYAAPMVIFIALAFPWALIQYQWSNDVAYQETLSRLGLIHRRLPAGPLVQIKILIVIMMIFFAARSKGWNDSYRRILGLLIAGILVLWQPLITGREAEFGNHYERVILFSLVPAFFCSIRDIVSSGAEKSLSVWQRLQIGMLRICGRLFPHFFLRDSQGISNISRYQYLYPTFIFFLCTSLIGISTFNTLHSSIINFDKTASKSENREELKKITTLLQSLSPQQVILIENRLSEHMMTYTSHIPFASYDAYMYIATDQELIDRARVYNVIVPDDPLTPRGVFGTKYENRRLAVRTQCILSHLLHFQEYGSCESIDVPCEQCALLDAPWMLSPEVTIQTLRDAHVSYLLLRTIPDVFEPYVEHRATVGRHTLYRLR